MKAVIIADTPGLREALAEQFAQRQRPWIALSSQEALSVLTATVGPCFVIDAASIERAGQHFFKSSERRFRHLADSCRQYGRPLLMISDSRVFPADELHRYREGDTPAPESAAGDLLWQREQCVAEHIEQHYILRTGPMISAHGQNLLGELMQQIWRGGRLTASEAPHFCPTSVHDLARVVSAMLDQFDCDAACWGTYHYNSAEAASCYEFAEAVLADATQYWDVGGGHVQLDVGPDCYGTEVLPLLACQHVRDTFGIQRVSWRQGVPALLKELALLSPEGSARAGPLPGRSAMSVDGSGLLAAGSEQSARPELPSGRSNRHPQRSQRLRQKTTR